MPREMQSYDKAIAAVATWLRTGDVDFQLEAEDAAAEQAAEERRERDWHDLESAARDFMQVYGVAAMLRCVSRATE